MNGPNPWRRRFAIAVIIALIGIPLVAGIFSATRTPESRRLRMIREGQQALSAHQDAADARLIRRLLDEELSGRRFAFPLVIETVTGRKVLPLDENHSVHREIRAAVEHAVRQAIERHNQPDSPVRDLRRINEASHFFETSLREILDDLPGFQCAIPPTAGGAIQRSGYPDLRLVHVESGTVAYLDPKLVDHRAVAGSFRTFYYEPKRGTSKVNEDAIHLLVGIEHDGNAGAWEFLRWHLVDLSGLQVRLKAEFQASNRDLYERGPDDATR